MSDDVTKMTTEELTARRDRLESAACKAIDMEKENLFDAADRKLQPVYNELDKRKVAH